VIVPERYCTFCKQEISLKRVRRGSCYCSRECRRKAKNNMRDFRAQFACRHCGRPPMKRQMRATPVDSSIAAPGAKSDEQLQVESMAEFLHKFERDLKQEPRDQLTVQ